MKQFSQKYLSSIKKISNLTLNACKNCFLPYACCDPMYGDIVEDSFPEESKFFPKGNSHKCKFLLKTGCSVPPEYRVLCSVHTCERNYMYGGKFADEYFKLREIISEELDCA